jgi:hypothetical protein
LSFIADSLDAEPPAYIAAMTTGKTPQRAHRDADEPFLAAVVGLTNGKTTEFLKYVSLDYTHMGAKDRRDFIAAAAAKAADGVYESAGTECAAGTVVLFNTAHYHRAPAMETNEVRRALFIPFNDAKNKTGEHVLWAHRHVP